ncbi:hypothetical protein BBB_1180 [Bifidobacterium bifidum BGN4]|uniref:Uncharacterized protein n=1 Tax=Bifidobacterium bifidum BGN4 TaxID=484020 RepID=I3WIQ9_BIFBI|nr:hypothetical protein BBB_1180 [Bifidobacterium bifidum BGN4]
MSPECKRDFRKPVWTAPAAVAFARRDDSADSRRLASMMAHPSMEGRLA